MGSYTTINTGDEWGSVQILTNLDLNRRFNVGDTLTSERPGEGWHIGISAKTGSGQVDAQYRHVVLILDKVVRAVGLIPEYARDLTGLGYPKNDEEDTWLTELNNEHGVPPTTPMV